MKGIVLCGGNGTRLQPATKVINKHLLPVFKKPMIYYPLETLIRAGINDIMIVTGKEHAGDFIELLGSGESFNAKFTYRVQERAGGIADALGLCENFSAGDDIVVILGDNMFGGALENGEFKSGARIFLSKTDDPKRFGVPTIDDDKIVKITEKPEIPASEYAVTGLYVYDNKVWDVLRTLKPSDRGELEITDVNNWYIDRGEMKYEIINSYWSDMGTPESLLKSSLYARDNNK